MPICWQALAPGVFFIDADGFQPVLFAPLQGVLMEVNQAYVSRFRKALGGDKEASLSLGLTPDILDSFIQTPPKLAARLDPKWPNAFEPTKATVFLTHKCTMRCAYCYCHGGEGLDMPWPVFERVVRFTADNAKRLGREMNLSFHGGDMGACWHLFQNGVAFAEQVCSEAGIRLQMTIGTNGFYTDEQARYLAGHMQSATLSVDGSPAVHDRCRQTVNGQPTLERVLRTARIFDEKELSYSVRMTITDEAVAALPEGVDYICRNTQAKAIRAEPLYCRGRAATSHLRSPDPDSFVEAFRKAQQVAQSHGRELSYSGARLIGVYCAFCSYPEPTFGVTPEGNLTCCYEILHPDDPLRDPFFYGSISEDGSRMDVNPARVEAIRDWSRKRRAECASCFCVNACAGDCAAKVMDGTLPEDEVPKRCQITRALVYDMIRAVLSGENPDPKTFISRTDIPEGSLCNCVDCSKPTSDGNQDTEILAGPGRAVIDPDASAGASGFRAESADAGIPEPLIRIRDEARAFQEHAEERSRTELHWQRQTKSIRQGVPSVCVADDGDTIHLGNLSPGCMACKSGQWDCLFLAMRCNLRCAFCLSPRHIADQPMQSAWGTDLSALCAQYANAGVRGVGFSGGEPLLQPELLLQWIVLLRRELPELYLWAYTNGLCLTSDLLGKLADAGLDELRFNLAASDYANDHVERMLYEAGRRLPAVAVEVPAIPDHQSRLLASLEAWAEGGVKYLNLHELVYEAGSPSENMPGARLSCRMPDGHRCDVHPDSSNVARSILVRVAERRLPLSVHYCSLRNKARQLRGRRCLLASRTLLSHERLLEDGSAESICIYAGTNIRFIHPSLLPALTRRPGNYRMALVRRLLPLSCNGEGQWVHFELLPGTSDGP